MRKLNLVESVKVSAGLIEINGLMDGKLIRISIVSGHSNQCKTLVFKDLTFTPNGCYYFGSPVISGGYYSGYKVEIQSLDFTSDEKFYASYKLTKFECL